MAGALLAFLLALLSPADDSGADPGWALVVSQRMLESGSAWLGDPALGVAADDYRVQSGVYPQWGVPTLSLPAVALARRFGLDMHRPADEAALQNLLSAACCGILFVLLHLLARSRVDGPSALAIATVFCFGSPLTSTLATGLWNSAYASVLLAATLLLWARRPAAGPLLPAAAILLAGLCRPTAGFFALGVAAFLLVRGSRRLAVGSLLAVIGAGVAVTWIGWDEVLYYYLPRRLLDPRAEPAEALAGLLVSPSRGLLVYCPYLVVVAAALVAGRARPLRDRAGRHLLVLVLVWFGAHLLGSSLRGMWWGGHAFGPRRFAEVVPGLALVAALAWERLEGQRARRRWGGAFLATGIVAIVLHAGIGLFDPWPRRWNEEPDVDDHPGLVWSLAHPQLLATASRHEERLLAHQRLTRVPVPPGRWIEPSSPWAAFAGFSPPEEEAARSWRWTRRPRARILLDWTPVSLPPSPLCTLALRAGSRDRQVVGVAIGGAPVGAVRLAGFASQRRLVGFPRRHLERSGELEIAFDLSDPAPTAADPRLLGMALEGMQLACPDADGTVTWEEDLFFGDGFSGAESAAEGSGGWRWTDGPEATLWLPVVGRTEAVELEGWSRDPQVLGLSVDGVDLGGREIPPSEGRTVWRWHLPATLQRAEEPRLLDLRLEPSDPRPAPADPRRLGFAVVRAQALPVDRRPPP